MRNITASAFLFAVLATPTYAFEVAPPGQIAAVIQDDTGKPLPGVTVTVTPNGATKPQLVITPADGVVKFTALETGNYLIKCELSGFFTLTLGPIPVRYGTTGADMPRLLKISMVPGAVQY